MPNIPNGIKVLGRDSINVNEMTEIRARACYLGADFGYGVDKTTFIIMKPSKRKPKPWGVRLTWCLVTAYAAMFAAAMAF